MARSLLKFKIMLNRFWYWNINHMLMTLNYAYALRRMCFLERMVIFWRSGDTSFCLIEFLKSRMVSWLSFKSRSCCGHWRFAQSLLVVKNQQRSPRPTLIAMCTLGQYRGFSWRISLRNLTKRWDKSVSTKLETSPLSWSKTLHGNVTDLPGCGWPASISPV